MNGPYPTVIPIVINTADRVWNVPKKYSQKVEAYGGIKDKVDVCYYLVDTHNYTMKELYKKNMMVAYAMMIEKAQNKEELVKTIKEITQKIDRKHASKMERILKYLLKSVLPNEEIEKMLKELKRKD